jgi:hypothetical protein
MENKVYQILKPLFSVWLAVLVCLHENSCGKLVGEGYEWSNYINLPNI